ncbi:TRAP transporter substrate-binding protein [Pengzhenrongella sicca]|uniref:TRAP transporter substrate-binding protein n=1 Tax=Pengzhenrongella sicca TaxID=2819238 RepID=A0A8A4ZB41_9MICO|nr:TRAP transporter substrate-binding protein [Pengzhenrongella sicca]QTE29200.1 TRAP transporter substrate-binding protein [Pengzhenrongella sicca]
MRRNKAVSIAALIGASVLAFSACSAGTGAAVSTADSSEAADSGPADTVFKLAFNQQPTHPQAVSLTAMGERLTERTDGRYGIEVFPNETLGAQRETIELVQAGTIEMAMIAGPLLENFNPDFVVFDLPFTFDSQAHQRETTNDPEIVSELYSSLDDQGIHVLGAFHGGVRNMYNSKGPITTPADLAGMKIRVIESDTNIEMMKLMGGSGTPMGMGEVYTAIQSGVIDGAENNELSYTSVKHSEVAPYYSYTRHLMLPDYLIVNPTVLAAMSAEDQEVLLDEISITVEEEGSLWETQVEEATQLAADSGVKFNEVDEAAFAAALEPLVESKLDNDFIRDIHAKVRAAAE